MLRPKVVWHGLDVRASDAFPDQAPELALYAAVKTGLFPLVAVHGRYTPSLVAEPWFAVNHWLRTAVPWNGRRAVLPCCERRAAVPTQLASVVPPCRRRLRADSGFRSHTTVKIPYNLGV